MAVTAVTAPPADGLVLDPAGLDALMGLLASDGWRLTGPLEVDGAIRIREVRGVADLPAGRGDEQSAGRYRLVDRDDGAFFAHVVGPDSARTLLSPESEVVVEIRRGDAAPSAAPPLSTRTAVIGLRGCDLAAMAITDRVFLGGEHPEERYGGRRRDLFVVAVDCAHPASTCWCTSMGTGPGVTDGYDLALTEFAGAGAHELWCRAGSAAGAEVLARLSALPDGWRPASEADETRRGAQVDRAAASIGRHLDVTGLAGRLRAALEHPHWDDVASRCLSCTNCTLVCPTCFCSTMVDSSDLSGDTASRTRVHDSCFTSRHSHVHPAPVRPTTRERYRQWLTHKLGTWEEQFGTAGCVGCGRCTTWCPVGIDLVAEAKAVAGP